MLTLLAIAEKTGRPYTTIKDLRRRYKEFFLDKKVSGKRYPMFINSSLDVTRDILDLQKEGLSSDEIRDKLKGKYQTLIDVSLKGMDDGVTEPVATDTTLDVYTRQQVSLFQAVQHQAEVIGRAIEGMGTVIKQNQELIKQNNQLISILTEKRKGRIKKHTDHHRRKPHPLKATTRPHKKQKKSVRKPSNVQKGLRFFSSLFK